ncbi:MAG: universal stress protein [Bacteroidales bacterium]|nr:universal stress protein [Bacteroidales bacterium]
MIKHAILATDFSKAVSKIIENSHELKSLGIERITLVHVLNLRDKIVTEDFTIESLEKKLLDQKKELERKGFIAESKMLYGLPPSELEKVRKEVEAGLIIVGSHGLTNNPSVIGNTASELLHNMQSPILLVVLKKIKENETDAINAKNIYQYERIMKELKNKEPEWEFYTKNFTKHVLLPTDFSDFSEAAFQWLKNQQVDISELTLMHIQDEVKIDKHLKHKLEEFNAIDNERLNRLSSSFQEKHPETKVNIVIEYGKPPEKILKFIKDKTINLTLMGSQGRGFISELFLGSVSLSVARHADSHVLLVPDPNK